MPGNSNRGAIPKKKRTSSSKEVPQNINTVPPTQRGQLNVLVDWAQLQDHQNQQHHSTQQPINSVHSKSRNNRGGEGAGFEIDNLSLQDHNNKFIPVRPIPRKNFANLDDQSTTNTAIVIPTTPNSSALQQSNSAGTNSSLLGDNNFNAIHILTPITRMDNSANTAASNNPFRNTASHHPHHLLSRPNIEDKLNQIQEYIRITTSLIDSVQNENCNREDYQNLVDNLTSLRDSERKLIALLPIAEEDMEVPPTNGERLTPTNGFMPINSNSLSDVSDAESTGPRPHSVQSINTATENTPVQTPTYEDVKYKLDSSTRNIQALKDQQNHILRLQQAAKQQLQEMELIRQNYGMTNNISSMDTTEEVHENVANLMNRISAITTFIQNQNDMANSLSENHGVDVLSEQAMLQNRLQELKNKKQHMESIVSELQSMNLDRQDHELTPTRIVPIDVERIVPIELTHQPSPKDKSQGNSVQSLPIPLQRPSAAPLAQAVPVQHLHSQIDEHPETEDEMPEGNAAVMQETATMLTEKISEINKMKDQLQRLKHMMSTVQMIEAKTGLGNEDEEEESAENSRSASVISQLSGDNAGAVRPDSEPERERAAGAEKPTINNRVEALEAMTHDLREQAISIAAERDRLRSVQNEIKTRREKVQSALEKNLQQISTSSNSSSQGVTAATVVTPKERQQALLKADLEAQKKELEKIEKMAETIKKTPAEASMWRNTNIAESGPKTKPPLATISATHQQQQQQPQAATNGGSKNSATDSGATDLFLPYETGSFPSDSTRSSNMIPPMPDLCTRTAKWRNNYSESTTHHQTSQVNENAAGSGGVGGGNAQRDHVSGGGTSPWLIYNGPSSAGGPQSPNFHTPFSGSEHLHHFNPYSLPHYANLPMPGTSAATADPLVFQHLLQTQQMMMNSITQCNQLLWIQQKEINNLNNAVLLLQERVLNAATNSIMNDSGNCGTMRAESTPPMNSQSQQSQIYSRARSEQPVNVTIPTQPQFQQNFSNVLPTAFPQPTSGGGNFGAQTTQYSVSQQIQRNNTNFNNRNFRNSAQRSISNTIYEQQSNCYQQPQPTDAHSNNFMNLNNPLQDNHHHPHSAMNNNNIQNNIQTSSNSNNSNLNANNLQYHQNLSSPQNNNLYMQRASATVAAATPPPPPQSRAAVMQQQQSTPALNNQVMPGNRANNYWDNFRSYSRQNLLSTNSCKSNEDSCSFITAHLSNPNNNIERNANNHNSMRNLNAPSSKFQCYHRNYSSNSNINQVNNVGVATTATGNGQQQPEIFNQLSDNDTFHINQQNPQPQQQVPQMHQQQHHHVAHGQQPNSLDLGELQFHTNPINLGVNEFKSKTLPKGGNNKKYAFPVRYRDCNNLVDDDEATGGDLNLARSSHYNDSKSTSKLFEALKENVYQEVKNLITANESRPHFLIQLFRELQLISSDPLRQRTLQSIQELYSRYVESAIIHEENNSNSLVAASEVPSRSMNNFEGQQQQQQPQQSVNSSSRSNDLNNIGYDFPTSQSTPRNLHQNLLQISISERELVNLIMTEIIDAIHAVDYISDNLLQQITNIVFTYSTDSSELEAANVDGGNFATINSKLNNKLIINNEDFLHHLHKWSRTDKDEFISNLENYLNNLMVGFSAASGVNDSGENGDVEDGMNSTVFSMDLAPVCTLHLPTAPISVVTNAGPNVMAPENVVVVMPDRQSYGFQPIAINTASQIAPVHPMHAAGGSNNRMKHYSESSSFVLDNCNGDLAEADQICGVGDNDNSEDDRNMETNDEACCLQPFILDDFQPPVDQQQQQAQDPQMWASNVEMDRKNNPKNTSM